MLKSWRDDPSIQLKNEGSLKIRLIFERHQKKPVITMLSIIN